jgi:hypothetical protein
MMPTTLPNASNGRSAPIPRYGTSRPTSNQGLEDLRLLQTDAGLVAFVTVATRPAASLTDAHALASRLEDDIRTADPSIADVVVHTEPAVFDPVEDTTRDAQHGLPGSDEGPTT